MNSSLLVRADWESGVLGVPVCKLDSFKATNWDEAVRLSDRVNAEGLKHDVAWISADVRQVPIFVPAALIDVNFSPACQYYDWYGHMNRVRFTMLPMKNRIKTRPIDLRDADEVSAIAETAFETGRFMADPYLPKGWGRKLYAAWGANSCRGYADEGIVHCDADGRITGFATARFVDEWTARLDLLAVRGDRRGSGLGLYLAVELIERLYQRGIEMMTARTEADNAAINALYPNLGFDLIGSGLILHWINYWGEHDE